MNNSIGKNTVYLYIRSLFTLVITLYTSRVVLDKLGISDFGIYNTVGSVTASLSFITGALGLATSRFITYDLGKKEINKLVITFRCIFTLYIIITFIMLIFFETAGPWFINNKLVFAPSRATAVQTVFHISILSVIFYVLQVPFTSLVIAHEKMDFFAFMGVLDAVSKLLVCYLLVISSHDRLITYSVLLLSVNILQLFVYVIYCKKKFIETKLKLCLDVKTIKSVGGFASWSLLGQLSLMLQQQGANIITNMFFGPTIVAARAISIQVSGAVDKFVSNFMTAGTPQIVKRHASGNEEASKQLVRKIIIIALLLATIVCFPLSLNADFILHLWLKEVPDYAVAFTQIILIQSIFNTIENGLYSIFYSQGRIKENAMISPLLSIIMFCVVYFMFKCGADPLALSYCYLINVIISCLVVKPLLIHFLFHYEWKFFRQIYRSIFILIILLSPFVIMRSVYISVISWKTIILETFILYAYLAFISYYLIFDKEMRLVLKTVLKNKISS